MSSSVKLAKTAVVMLFVVSAILNGFATLVSVYQSGDRNAEHRRRLVLEQGSERRRHQGDERDGRTQEWR